MTVIWGRQMWLSLTLADIDKDLAAARDAHYIRSVHNSASVSSTSMCTHPQMLTTHWTEKRYAACLLKFVGKRWCQFLRVVSERSKAINESKAAAEQ